MWMIINAFAYETTVEEFDTYEEAEDRFNELNNQWIDGRTIYIAEVKSYIKQHKGKFRWNLYEEAESYITRQNI